MGRLLSRFIVSSSLAVFSVLQLPVNADAPAFPAEQTKAKSADVHKLSADESSREGIVIARADSGKVVYCCNETQLFNPASNTKMATALVILRKLGPNYRFRTEIRSNGKINAHGELEGDLFVSGEDPLFGDRQARALADLLKKKNIKSIKGDFCVTKDFSMNLQITGLQAGKMLVANVDPNHASAKSLRAEYDPQLHRPILTLHGQVKVAIPPVDSKIIACHESVQLQTVLKTMLCFSVNDMAERLGDMIGGPRELSNYLIKNLGIPKGELSFSTTSGVKINRITPRAMMKVLFSLRSDLFKLKMGLSDLLPVAGVDNGTMSDRLCSEGELGSVIAKTGSLWDVDNGASALSGEMNTSRQGRFLFVIFNMNGNMDTFRNRQDEIVSRFQKGHSGAKAYKYTPVPLIYTSADQWSN